MIYLDLFLVFLRISFFNFGGGFAMISLIQNELISHRWITSTEFANIVAISQMTPGAFAINTATYVGYSVAGLMGAFVATVAIPMPSAVFSLIISRQLKKFKDHQVTKAIFYGIRPVVVGLIANAAILIAETSLFQSSISKNTIMDLIKQPLNVLNIGSLIILPIVLIFIFKFKLHPILVILSSAILGIIVFSIV
ncbi:MAG: chromate transporter [Clostridiales bacterium]|nr:chromate transporter [Clostridiales bacterium]